VGVAGMSGSACYITIGFVTGQKWWKIFVFFGVGSLVVLFSFLSSVLPHFCGAVVLLPSFEA
jgi:hypothetical protein